jgi:hypothetical protein
MAAVRDEDLIRRAIAKKINKKHQKINKEPEYGFFVALR